MGRSISEYVQNRMDALADEGRLCANSQSHCVAKATVQVSQEVWSTAINVGSSRVLCVTLCPGHAALMPVGYHGTNFIVNAQTEY